MNLVVNYAAYTSREDLYCLFKPYGPVERITLLAGADDEHEGLAVVRMEKQYAGKQTVYQQLNGRFWRGYRLRVYFPLFLH